MIENRQGKTKLDRTAWIGLIAAGLLMALYMQSSTKLAKEKAAADAVKRKADAEKVVEGGGAAPGIDAVILPGEDGTSGAETPAPAEVLEEVTTLLKRDDVRLQFSSIGGGLKYAEFLDQQEVGDKSINVRLNRFGKHVIGALVGGPDDYIDGDYKVTKSTAREIEYLGKTKTGLFVKKRWTFVEDKERGAKYRLKLQLIIENQTDAVVDLSSLGLFAGSAAPLHQREMKGQNGVFYNEDRDFSIKKDTWFAKNDLLEKDLETVLYTGVSNQFFASILTPAKPYSGSMWAKASEVKLPEAAGGGKRQAIRAAFSLPSDQLAPNGGKKVIDYEIYVGPRRNGIMRNIGNDRGNVMNYGWFGLISGFLNVVLNWLHDNVFDHLSHKWAWGLSIIALTILIRGAMWPLQNKSTRSMKRMSKLQPEMVKLKEKFPDDPQKQQQETMKLYREYNINPVGGCLPMFVQIPVFFGFYRMLQSAVELRQEEFLWVADLSQPDTLHTFNLPFSLPFLGNELPLNILPIVMAATMVLQMALSPKAGDKMQQRIFMLMPLMFFFFCYNFASALALYWSTSNVFAIVQMLIMKRLPEPELKKAAPGKVKRGFFERMQERAEAAQQQKKAGGRPGGGNQPQKPKKPRGPRTGG